ncbi:MAG: hypothetical protein JO127_06235 [Caulobacteraceae bacterium]|nr:hypothetical protein [Caulobacteraceae bacterium]
MRKLLISAGVAALALPSLAMAQASDCYEHKQNTRIAGTLLGAGAGALIGGSVAGHGSKGTGAVIGAIGGGVVGNVAAGAAAKCGYYDSHGVWRTSGGYYDGYDRWVDYSPSGYYDAHGHWIAAAPSASTYGEETSYVGRSDDIDRRANWLGRRIQAGEDRGALSRDDADDAYRELNRIRQREARLMDYHGGLTVDDRAELSTRLDRLSGRVSRDSNSGY